MSEIENRVAKARVAAGLSQVALADRARVSRQTLASIEHGRSVPSTAVALRLARVLGCGVDALFSLPSPRVDIAGLEPGTRVTLGMVESCWVAHPMRPGSTAAADGLAVPGGVEILGDVERLEQTVLVSGCAPVLGALADQLSQGSWGGARWLQRTSGQALEDLARGRTHLAGLHLAAADTPQTHERIVSQRMPGVELDIVSLVGWREGLAVAPGNPLEIRDVEDLARSGVRIARRAPGSGAEQVLCEALTRVGIGALPGRSVRSHAEAGTAILHGAVDAAVLIEPVAEALGLPFIPLSEECFELVFRRDQRSHPGVSRLLEQLAGTRFGREVRAMGAYDTSTMGAVRQPRAA